MTNACWELFTLFLQRPSSPVADGRARRPVSAEPPPFPGASKHVHHPHACSTPRKNDPQPRHVRSATEPMAVGELQSEAVGKDGTEKHQGVGGEPLQSVSVDEKLRRKEVQAKRKLNTKRTRHKRSRSADTKKNHDPNYRRSTFTNELVSEKDVPSSLDDHGLHVQAYCSSMPNFCPYHHYHHHHHPCYAFGSQYPTLPLPPPPLLCPHCALAQQQQQQTLPQWPKARAGGERESGPSQRCNSAPGVHMGPTDNTEQPPPSATAKASVTGVLGDGSSSSGVQSIQLLAEEMLSTLQHSIDAIRKTAGISKYAGKFIILGWRTDLSLAGFFST